MNKRYCANLIFLSLLVYQGCTNKLYHGEIDASNSDNQESKVVFYWTKTELFIGNDKAGPGILMTECSTRRLTFLEREDGIYFFGTQGMDKLADQTPLTSQDIQCGKIVNEMRFTDIQAGPVNIAIGCLADIDEFTVLTGRYSPAYVKASKEPYAFAIMESSSWSFFGEPLDTPSQPECRQ